MKQEKEKMTLAPERKALPTTQKLFVDRWSPRAFSSAEISVEEVESLFDAARWAPSAYNSQPWRFMYARRGTAVWEKFLSWLVPFNQSWASQASVLVYVVSETHMLSPSGEKVISSTHAYDCGAAAMLLQLQATATGWAAHSMSGFDNEAALKGLALPEGYAVHCAIAIGRQGNVQNLPEGLQAREKPSDRSPLSVLAWEGVFSDGPSGDAG
jgi:nitroreductase